MIPDIVILDRESRKKCSIYPLRYRDDLSFIHSSQLKKHTFEGYLLLHVDGEPLSCEDKDYPLLLIDASWRWAQRIFNQNPHIASLPKRSLNGFYTAYPRKSKIFEMPDNGLSSVEALYIARSIQGREDASLLEHYYWKDSFLSINQTQLKQ